MEEGDFVKSPPLFFFNKKEEVLQSPMGNKTTFYIFAE